MVAYELKMSLSLCTSVANSPVDNDCSKEIKRRIARATGAMAGFKKVWNSISISTWTKLGIIRTCVMSVLLCACETWTLRKRDMDIDGIGNEMLQKNSPNTLAAENKKFRGKTKA